MKKYNRDAIIKSLLESGFDAESIELIYGHGVKVNTDYDGPYPTKETFDKVNALRKKYSKRYTVEERGHYTAVFIY